MGSVFIDEISKYDGAFAQAAKGTSSADCIEYSQKRQRKFREPNYDGLNEIRSIQRVVKREIRAPVQNLSIKDAIELIPKYDGFNIPLINFLQGYREACGVIPAANEPELAKLIKMRLSGEAFKIAQSKCSNSIDEIEKFFHGIFGSAENFHQLHGELAIFKQKKDESVISFSSRVKRIEQEILEVAAREKRVKVEFRDGLE
ncbi:hypothetical protein QAD02_002258 [Eretmocerus hayati]|uniref:Uncharacterized protein n=1 Tax=Eretmocerus hayati TaxID=131215 RepID=A0ACC2NL06_9HYME|nr:hypothetical protein QAD02_002258 [Eretmocerus hayati]